MILEAMNSQLVSDIASLGVCSIESSLTLSTAVSSLIQQYQMLKEKQAQQWIPSSLERALSVMKELQDGNSDNKENGEDKVPEKMVSDKLKDHSAYKSTSFPDGTQPTLMENLLKIIKQGDQSSVPDSDSLNRQFLSV